MIPEEIVKAIKTNRKSILAMPSQLYSPALLRAALGAILAGIKTHDWDCVAEGYVMLDELDSRLVSAIKLRKRR